MLTGTDKPDRDPDATGGLCETVLQPTISSTHEQLKDECREYGTYIVLGKLKCMMSRISLPDDWVNPAVGALPVVVYGVMWYASFLCSHSH
jgi:hypothetical protein